eukprot:3007068-Prymnesium_polylepis.2
MQSSGRGGAERVAADRRRAAGTLSAAWHTIHGAAGASGFLRHGAALGCGARPVAHRVGGGAVYGRAARAAAVVGAPLVRWLRAAALPQSGLNLGKVVVRVAAAWPARPPCGDGRHGWAHAADGPLARAAWSRPAVARFAQRSPWARHGRRVGGRGRRMAPPRLSRFAMRARILTSSV